MPKLEKYGRCMQGNIACQTDGVLLLCHYTSGSWQTTLFCRWPESNPGLTLDTVRYSDPLLINTPVQFKSMQALLSSSERISCHTERRYVLRLWWLPFSVYRRDFNGGPFGVKFGNSILRRLSELW